MLLLMVQAQGEQIGFQPVAWPLGQPRLHAAVDLGAISHDLGQRRTGHQAPLSPLDPFAQRLIVGVEHGVKPLVDDAIAGPARQDHRLEEPADMAQVPFARTGVGHGLGRQVFRRKASRQLRHPRPHPPIDLDILIGDRGNPNRLIHSRNSF
ncbi:hypothetical protein D3C81_1392590 [compost metagenome]